MTITPSQLRAIHTLLSKQGLRDEKDSIVSSFTAGRTTHSSAMLFDEAAALIGHLKSLDPEDKASDKMRNKILSMAHEMGWRLAPREGEVKGRVDMKRVDNWCLKYGHVKKRLDDYKYNELPKLVSQFDEVYKGHLSKV